MVAGRLRRTGPRGRTRSRCGCSAETAGEASDGLLEAASAAIGAIRKAKSQARLPMRASAARLVVTAPPPYLAALAQVSPTCRRRARWRRWTCARAPARSRCTRSRSERPGRPGGPGPGRPPPAGSLTGMDKVQRTDEEWRQQLTPEEYHVLRQAGTEAPFTGEYTDTKTEGVYRCRACGAELFRSDAKFESHCGWPSFYQPTEDDAVILLEDRSGGMVRTEVRCAACDSHLGHVFEGEGYQVPTDQRWCINSVSLTLEPAQSP